MLEMHKKMQQKWVSPSILLPSVDNTCEAHQEEMMAEPPPPRQYPVAPGCLGHTDSGLGGGDPAAESQLSFRVRFRPVFYQDPPGHGGWGTSDGLVPSRLWG